MDERELRRQAEPVPLLPRRYYQRCPLLIHPPGWVPHGQPVFLRVLERELPPEPGWLAGSSASQQDLREWLVLGKVVHAASSRSA